MKDIKNILLNANSTIKEALEVINVGAMKIALVIDSQGKLIGTLSDGDIRRGLLSNLSLTDNIDKIIFRNPTVCSVDTTQEEILEIAIKYNIYQIPIVDSKGKLLGLERIDELLKPDQKINKVVLMVGGLGKRLRPLTENTPKPMLKVGNRPLLETIILNFKKHGFTNIILSVGYKSEIIVDYFKDGRNFGVNIEYIFEEQRMGTAGALGLMKDKLKDPFFVMNGDLLTNINFENMMQYHLEHNSFATMGVREYDFQVPYGVLNVEDNRILSIEEKPVHTFFVNGGIYILNNEVLSLIPLNKLYDMPTLFEDVIELGKKSISFPIKEYWLDIGRMEEFQQANNEYFQVFN